jgi:hypothetical protein
MKVTLFLSAKNIVSHMIREELKYLDKNVILFHSFTKQFCIIKSFLLVTTAYQSSSTL